MSTYVLVFDAMIVKQLAKASKNKHLTDLLSNIFDKIAERGPWAGKLIDSQNFIYEVKMKHPPLRVYYMPIAGLNEMRIMEYGLKTSPEKQHGLIEKLKERLSKSKIFSVIFLPVFDICFKFLEPFS